MRLLWTFFSFCCRPTSGKALRVIIEVSGHMTHDDIVGVRNYLQEKARAMAMDRIRATSQALRKSSVLP
jgi:hypothetical protein